MSLGRRAWGRVEGCEDGREGAGEVRDGWGMGLAQGQGRGRWGTMGRRWEERRRAKAQQLGTGLCRQTDGGRDGRSDVGGDGRRKPVQGPCRTNGAADEPSRPKDRRNLDEGLATVVVNGWRIATVDGKMGRGGGVGRGGEYGQAQYEGK